MSTIYATVGKKCGQVHCYEFEPSPIGMILREVDIKNGRDYDRLYFDETAKYSNIEEVLKKTKRKKEHTDEK